jgi:hypothetical protein
MDLRDRQEAEISANPLLQVYALVPAIGHLVLKSVVRLIADLDSGDLAAELFREPRCELGIGRMIVQVSVEVAA